MQLMGAIVVMHHGKPYPSGTGGENDGPLESGRSGIVGRPHPNLMEY